MDTDEIYSSWGGPILDKIEVFKFFANAGLEQSRLFSFAGDDFYALKFIQDKLMEEFEAEFPSLISELCNRYGIPNRAIAIPGTDRINSTLLVVRKNARDIAICFANHPSAQIIGEKNGTEIEAVLSEEGIPLENVVVASLTDDEAWDSWYENHVSRTFPGDSSLHMDALCLFKRLFGVDETDTFVRYLSRFRMMASFASGIQVTALPTENVLSLFREDLRRSFAEEYQFRVEGIIRGYGAAEKLVVKLREKVIGEGWSDCLFGQSDFAASFLSSEWRRRADGRLENLERTGTVSGYIKCVEQLCSSILGYFAQTRTSSITLRAPRGNKSGPWGNKVYMVNGTLTSEQPSEKKPKVFFKYPLTEDFLESRGHEVTLGTMSAFFSHQELCGDIFDCAVTKSCSGGNSLMGILDSVLSDFTKQMRNDKFHKSNFFDKEEVERIRFQAVAVAWLLFGGISFTSSQRVAFLGGDPNQDMVAVIKEGISKAVRDFKPNDISSYDAMRFFFPKKRSGEGKWIPAINLFKGDDPNTNVPNPSAIIYTSWHSDIALEDALKVFEKAVLRFMEDVLKDETWISNLSVVTMISPLGTKVLYTRNSKSGILEKPSVSQYNPHVHSSQSPA